MPEYLAPGVYVIEIPLKVKPLEGVSIPGNAVARKIVMDVRRHLGPAAPAWTDPIVSDPGVTLIELFAWLAEVLLSRMNSIPERSICHVSRLAVAALSLIHDRDPSAGCPDKNVRFMSGRLLTARDLTDEQQYHRSPAKRHRRKRGSKNRGANISREVASR